MKSTTGKYHPVWFDPKKAKMPKLFGGKPTWMGDSSYSIAGLKLLKKFKKRRKKRR